MGVALALVAGGLGLSGCGSSSSSTNHDGASAGSPHTTTLASGQTLVEAADRVDQASGYRLAATIVIKLGAAPVSMDMTGVIGKHGTVGALSANETIDGHKLDLQIRFAHQTYYMTGIPGLSAAAHGRHWLSYNLAKAQQAEGLGGLQGAVSSNPAQFLTYLAPSGRISSASATRRSTATRRPNTGPRSISTATSG